jgi:hypothetical protein
MLNVSQVARASVKEQVFDVGHLEAVKIRLKALLTSELTPISDMCHASSTAERPIEQQGMCVN